LRKREGFQNNKLPLDFFAEVVKTYHKNKSTKKMKKGKIESLLNANKHTGSKCPHYQKHEKQFSSAHLSQSACK